MEGKRTRIVMISGARTGPEEDGVFKGLAGLGSLLKQAHQISGRMQGLTDELRKKRVTGSAGGGMVQVDVNGMMEVLGCRIDPSLVEQRDRELLEDLVATAIGQAVAKSRQLHAEAMKEMTGGMEIPGLEEALSKMLGGETPPKES